MAAETEVVFPRSLSSIFPAAAQQVYIETYKKSWATTVAGTQDGLSRESLVARDSWDAVKREFMQDDVTHKWYRIGEQIPVQETRAEKQSVFDAIRSLFRR